MGFLGGDLALIGEGAALLRRQAVALSQRQAGITQARGQGERGCGGSAVAAALHRVEAAYGASLAGVETEVRALGTLADSTGRDIAIATAAGQVADLFGVFR